MQLRRRLTVASAAVLLIAGCSPASSGSPSPQTTAPHQERTLTVSISQEPSFVAPVSPAPGTAGTAFYQRLFSAFLDLYDDQGRAHAYLAETLPALDTDSWKLLPDGRMETRYTLKPSLTWHDGAPLTGDDFAFAFQVITPSNGFRTNVTPYSVMETVAAPDDRSVVIRWKSLYPGAGVLLGGGTRFGLAPFPRHLLGQQFLSLSIEAFQEHPYWTREFIGAGPYKLSRWELGSFLEATAFDQHVNERARIDRIRMLFTPDPNAAVANLLAETTDVAINTITFANMLDLKREWATTGRGTGDFTATSLSTVWFQSRPEFANPAAILDLRIRRALAYGIDKQTFTEVVYGGELKVLDTIFEPTAEYYPAIDRAITKYPYDPRASERLMSEAGYTKGPDGAYAGPQGKLSLIMIATQGRQELPVLAAGWRQIGFDVHEQTLTQTQAQDGTSNAQFSALNVTQAGAYEDQQVQLYRPSEVPNPQNPQGMNRGGWVSPAYDRLVETFNRTMDPRERVQQRAEMGRIITEELPSIVLTYNPNAHAFLSHVKGITRTALYTTGRVTWNIDKWEVQ